MESRSYLGIYIREDRATVACLASQGREDKLVGAFSVDIQGQDRPSLQALADGIAQQCAERRLKAGTAVVALDCALFMQHAVHSDFSDHKKIAATIRFDTEEALATDVSDMAVAFRLISSDESGARLDVFTTERSVLSDILMSLQSNGVDPVAVVPDVCCLSRYISRGKNDMETDPAGTVYALLSESRGYLLGTPNAEGGSLIRAFPVAPSQDRKALLARETLVTTALAGTGNSTRVLSVLDTQDAAMARDLAERVPVDVVDCDLASMRGVATGELAEGLDLVDVAIAYGAALPESEKDKGINFRNDHMPYLGKKVRLQKAVRFLSVSLTILFLAAGVYAHTQLMTVKRYQSTLRGKLEPDYLAVMPGADKLPSRMGAVVQRLKGVLRRLEAEQGGQVDPKSISAKLTLVLKALNSCAAQTDLHIDVITLTAQSIQINGDTSSRRNTLKVFDAMGKAGLTLQKPGYSEKGGRDTFTASAEPKKEIAP
jgi:hypothetical protein